MPPTQLPSHTLPAPGLLSVILLLSTYPPVCLTVPSVQGLGHLHFYLPIVSQDPQWKGVQTISLSKGRKKFVKLEPQNTYILQLYLI